MIKNCWQHDEMLTYRILEDYTDDVCQLLLAPRKDGLYVERIQKRQDLKNKVPYCWQEDTTFATLIREKIEKSMRDADHFNAIQEPCQLPEKEMHHQCIMRHSERQRFVPYDCWKSWIIIRLHSNEICATIFYVIFVLCVLVVSCQESGNLRSK